jgi:sugar lactone lactonase YvrE
MGAHAAELEYRLTARIAGKGGLPAQFREALRGVAVADGRVYAVGDSALKVFDADGALVCLWPTARPAECVAVDGAGQAWVGEWKQVEIFDPSRGLVSTFRDPPRLGRVTAIGFAKGELFLADALARRIRRYDAERLFLNDIGDTHRKGGFDIPNGVVDFAVAGDGEIRVANPGMHRVERYAPDGTLLSRFGRFDGRDPAGFGGCCNPTNVAVDARGRVIVSEKAGPRVKVYDAAGELLSVVADTAFDPGCRNMDVAFGAQGRVYVADTVRLEICVFDPVAAGGA